MKFHNCAARNNYYGYGGAFEVASSMGMKQHDIQLVTNEFEYIGENFTAYCNDIHVNSNTNYNIIHNSTKPDKIGQWQIDRLLGKGGFAKV